MVTSRPVGEHALLVLFDDARQAAAARDLVSRIAEGGAPGLVAPLDVVPAARTLLLDGLPGRDDVRAWASRLAGVRASDLAGGRIGERTTVTVETRYDGPDLEAVARAWGCAPEEVAARHQATTFEVEFCGFAPGFAYCVAAPPLPEVPRREDPRRRVAAGSVALAGPYCGVYPAAMPGGWQVVGTTDVVLFDPARGRPALLAPGDVVVFRAVG